jgi:hypothetical protein
MDFGTPRGGGGFASVSQGFVTSQTFAEVEEIPFFQVLLPIPIAQKEGENLFELQDKRHVSSDSFVFTYVLFDRTLSILLTFFVVY